VALAPGSRLGTYEITGAIGAGGMGEVYRARDAKLGRDAAIKVLPAALAQDTERLARFEREARLLASLNHPNIAHIYGFESATLADGSAAHFLAMEMVLGEDLAERLERGAIAVDEAIAIARQIADGLEEAHEHGIVHRDLKPANVKVTPDGKVKVLDFGLAKAIEEDAGASGGASQLSHSPTMSRHATDAGIILGTAAYMSPEQARGGAWSLRVGTSAARSCSPPPATARGERPGSPRHRFPAPGQPPSRRTADAFSSTRARPRTPAATSTCSASPTRPSPP
jgi:serine/threonine protein kinase